MTQSTAPCPCSHPFCTPSTFISSNSPQSGAPFKLSPEAHVNQRQKHRHATVAVNPLPRRKSFILSLFSALAQLASCILEPVTGQEHVTELPYFRMASKRREKVRVGDRERHSVWVSSEQYPIILFSCTPRPPAPMI